MEQIIHIYTINECGKKCPLCCNKLYNIDEIPVVTVDELYNADTICITGGDPFLYNDLYKFVDNIKMQYPNIKNIYAYTSGTALLNYLNVNHDKPLNLDGVSIAPKDKTDWNNLKTILLNETYNKIIASMKSNRLMIFDNQKDNFNQIMNDVNLDMFNIMGRKWQDTFNTPSNEIFRRLPILF
jgi:hypothetical protein